jgi:aldehyde dehydrogenase (NAD+)
VLRRDKLQEAKKRKCYEELSNICVDAAEHSLRILQMLADESLLSSLNPSEFNYILELVQVFLTAFARDHSEQHITNVRACLAILKSMDDIGWTQRARPEVIHQLTESGVLDEGVDYAASMQDFANFLTGGGNSIENYDFIFGGSQNLDGGMGHQSLALAEVDFGDAAASEELLHQISSLSQLPGFVAQ